jgi:hypothetical protein
LIKISLPFKYKDHDQSESKVPFYEHVFLEDHLDQFPQIEPIQQFMALALNGISQNSFLNIQEKKEIIEWYKNYFNEKLDIIQESLYADEIENQTALSSFNSNVNRNNKINKSNSSKNFIK